jgi:phospholipid/cholesterol/gamma-HCH transport system permease protein
VQALGFFVEIGPLVTSLLVAGRVGSGIGAVLSNMRATEQIDAIESLSVDSFKFLVVPRIVACTVALPILTIFMDFAGLLGGFASEYATSRLSLKLYVFRSFSSFEWSNFYPPTLKTAVFGFVIGTVSCFLGYTTNEGPGRRTAATRSVVSLPADHSSGVLIKFIFFCSGARCDEGRRGGRFTGVEMFGAKQVCAMSRSRFGRAKRSAFSAAAEPARA